MTEKMLYLHLLILCGVWSQGIIGTLADEEIKESSVSDLLVREKRVIDRTPGGDNPVGIRDLPYVVHIKFGMRIHCVGTILSHYVVITVASCVEAEAIYYQIVSASPRSNRGTRHSITDIKKRYGNHPNRPSDGVALLTVDPPFGYGVYTNQIELHSGPLLAGINATVSGWGFNPTEEGRGTEHPVRLRSIEVPIMGHRDCVNRYRHLFVISDMDICTYHPQKYCGHNDGGAPLVVDGYLAGVHLRTGMRPHMDENLPDIFIMLQHSAYNQWIRTNVQNSYGQNHNQHH